MGAINPAIYEEMEISAETTTGTPKTIDLKLGVVSFNYYEDLFSPCLTAQLLICLLYTSPSPRDGLLSRMPSSA